MNENRRVLLTARPKGIPQAEHFQIESLPIPELKAGEVLIRNHYLSVEPAMRGWVSDEGNYAEPVAIGAVMRSFATGVVQETKDPTFQAGDVVTGMFGWQDYAAVDGDTIIRKVENDDLPISTSLGVLGLNGLTAYFGLLDVCAPEPGDTVVVSTAAGAVGSCVGQIAKLRGCQTVGITGGAKKKSICRDEFGYDVVLDYKDPDFATEFANHCDGVDVYFDNTAGAVSDVVMQHLNRGARIVICGTASIAEWNPIPHGPRVNRQLLVARAKLQGFLVLDYVDRYASALVDLAAWVRDGKINYREDVLTGIESAPDAIAGLYRGENFGKRLIKLV